MSQPRSDATFLEDILVATRNALKFVRGTSFEEFSADEKTNYAVIRAFEIIGEANEENFTLLQGAPSRYALEAHGGHAG